MTPMQLFEGSRTKQERLGKKHELAERGLAALALAVRQHEDTARGQIASPARPNDRQLCRRLQTPAPDMRRALRAMTSLRRPEELRVEARYHRERHDLYWAEIYGSRATSRFRPKGLERACVLAEARLRRAE
jgi:hypothetical protein